MTLEEQLKLKGIEISRTSANEQNKDILLFNAVNGRNITEIKRLLDNGADINCVNSFGQTPLMIAVDIMAKEVVSLLLQNGADINASDKTGQTALMIAALKNFEEIGNFLLRNGADYEIKNSKKLTARDIACKTWSRKLEKYFLSRPISLDFKATDIIIFWLYNFVIEKEIGESFDYSYIENEFRKKYKRELNSSDFEYAINHVNSKLANKSISIVFRDNKIFLIPNMHEIIKCCEKFLKTRKIGDTFDFRELSKDSNLRYCEDFKDEYLYESLKSLKEKNTAIDFDVRKKSCIWECIPDASIIKQYCVDFFSNKKIGDVLFFEDIKKDFCRKYILLPSNFIDLLKNGIEELITHDKLNFDIQSNENKLQLVPSKKEIHDFCMLFITDPKCGDRINLDEIENLFYQKYNCHLSEITNSNVFNTIYSIIKTKTENTGIYILRTERELQLVPSKQEIDNFCLSIITDLKCGDRINLDEIENLFYQKYNCYLSEITNSNVFNTIYSIIKTKTENTGIYILRTERELQLVPSKQEIDNFCLSIITDMKCGDRINLDEIENLFYQKYNCHLSEITDSDALETIYSLAKQSYTNLKTSIILTENEIVFFFSQPELNRFFESIFNENNKNRFYSIIDIYKKFIAKYESSYSYEELIDILEKTVQKFTPNGENLIFKKFFDWYVVLDKDDEIVNVLNAVFPTKIHRKNMHLSDETILKMNKGLEENGFIFRPMKMNDETFILTAKTISAHENYIKYTIAHFIQDKLFTKESGYSEDKNILLEEIESIFDLPIDEECFCSILEIANDELVEKIIEYNKENKLISVKMRELEDTIMNSICPACNLIFEDDLNELKNHILLTHTSTNYSIIRNTNSNLFCCKHCGHENLSLHQAHYRVLFKHVIGYCKEKDFFSKQTKPYFEDIGFGKRIYHGTAYAASDSNNYSEDNYD